MQHTYSAINYIVTGKKINSLMFKEISEEYPKYLFETFDLNVGDTLNQIESEEILLHICQSIHPDCDIYCPVFEINDNKIPLNKKGKGNKCKCFKDGNKMLNFIKHKMET